VVNIRHFRTQKQHPGAGQNSRARRMVDSPFPRLRYFMELLSLS